MSRLAIYYGRILYIEPHPGQETFMPREPIREAVEAATSTARYGHEWVLGNLEVDEASGLITGRLGYPDTDRRTHQDYDPEQHRFVEQLYELPDAVSSPFVLDYRSGAMAFEADNQIRPTGFVNHFVALLNEARKGEFKGELVRLAEDYRDFIRKVDKITAVSFEVRPTNPRDRLIFRPLDEGMKVANAERQRVLIENNEDGLVVNPPATRDEMTANPAVQGIEMVEEGYGEKYRIDAEKDGRPLRYDSRRGGLLRDLLEDASDDPQERTETLRDFLSQRADFLQPGQAPAAPLDAETDADDEMGEDWREEP